MNRPAEPPRKRSHYCIDRAFGEWIRCPHITGDGGFCRNDEREPDPYQPCARVEAAKAAPDAVRALGEPALIRPLAITQHPERLLVPGALSVGADALAALLAHVQSEGANEAGGVLLGRYMHDGGMVIDAISTPGPKDVAAPRYFYRDAEHHNAVVMAAWKASGGRVHYLGNWHTHSEPVPFPSSLDLSEWARDAGEIRAQHREPELPLVYLIVGQTHILTSAAGDPGMAPTLRPTGS